jgi:NitT/TauT family transport system substrate-binding protein
MMKINNVWPAFAVMAVVAFVLLATFAVWQPAGQPEGAKLRLAINQWPGYELLYVGQVKGFYEQEGLDVDLVQFSTLDDARRSFERGQVDAIAATLVDIVQIHRDRGEMPKILLAADYSDGGDVIVSMKQRAPSVRSLKGKRVGVEQMFGRFVLDRALRLQGLSLGDVHLVETSVMGASRLLQRGEVDAIVTYFPYVIETLKVAGTTTIFTTKEVPGEIFDVVATRNEDLQRIPDLQGKLTRVWSKAFDFLKTNPQEAMEIMARREGVTVDEFKAALAGVKLVPAEQQAAVLAPGGAVAEAIEVLLHVPGWKGKAVAETVSAQEFLTRPSDVGMGN